MRRYLNILINISIFLFVVCFAFPASSADASPCAETATLGNKNFRWSNIDGEALQIAHPVSWEFAGIKGVPSPRKSDDQTIDFEDRKVCFTAVRMDLRHYSISVVDTRSKLESNKSTYRRVKQLADQTGIEKIYRYNIDTLFDEIYVFPKYFPLVIFNAGWSEGFDNPVPLGFLKVGPIIQGFARFKSLSALVCFSRDRAGDQRRGSQNIDVINYKPGKENEAEMKSIQKVLRNCEEIVQVGPRIIEKDNSELRSSSEKYSKCLEGSKTGICSHTLNYRRRKLSVFALSEKSNDRQFAYFLMTHNDTALFDVQNLLLDKAFVGESEPVSWAVNLAGGDVSRLVMRASGLEGGQLKLGPGRNAVHVSALVARKTSRQGN